MDPGFESPFAKTRRTRKTFLMTGHWRPPGAPIQARSAQGKRTERTRGAERHRCARMSGAPPTSSTLFPLGTSLN